MRRPLGRLAQAEVLWPARLTARSGLARRRCLAGFPSPPGSLPAAPEAASVAAAGAPFAAPAVFPASAAGAAFAALSVGSVLPAAGAPFVVPPIAPALPAAGALFDELGAAPL